MNLIIMYNFDLYGLKLFKLNKSGNIYNMIICKIIRIDILII